MNGIKLKQGSREWFEARKGLYTASGIYKLMTDPRSKADKEAGKLSETAKGYVMEKLAEELLDYRAEFSNAAMEFGNEFEPDARDYYSIHTSQEVEETGFWTFEDIAGASPDGLVGDDGLVEIKCPYNPIVHLENLIINSEEEFIKKRKEYYYQMQFQLLCTGREWCDFVSYNPRSPNYRIKVLRINKDETIIIDMITRIARAEKYRAELKELIVLSELELI